MIARHFPQRHIDRLNGIRGVDDLAYVLWESKQWDHSSPMSAPRLTNAGIERIPLFSKQFQIEFGFRLGTGGVNGFEVTGHLFHMLVRHITQGVAHQMHHAQLHPCLRIDGLNRFR